MAIGGDPIRHDAGHRLGRSEDRLGGSEVTMLAQHDVHQSAVAIDGAIEIPPAATHSDIGLINIPTAADAAFASSPQVLGQRRR